MEEKKLIAKYAGTLEMLGHKLKCFNLEDGSRYFASNSIQVVLKMVREGEQKERGTNLGKFLNQKSLKPFVDKQKCIRTFEPTVFYYKGVKINGYEATTLVDVCNIYLALEKGAINQGKKLTKGQTIIANESRLALGAIAKVGLFALIDEATGYQYERERFALQKIFKLLVLEDGIFSEVKKMFPLDYYKELFEVYDVDFTAENIRRKPRFIG
jgi:hypothetical protein